MKRNDNNKNINPKPATTPVLPPRLPQPQTHIQQQYRQREHGSSTVDSVVIDNRKNSAASIEDGDGNGRDGMIAGAGIGPGGRTQNPESSLRTPRPGGHQHPQLMESALEIALEI